jgi:hypothetical protein
MNLIDFSSVVWSPDGHPLRGLDDGCTGPVDSTTTVVSAVTISNGARVKPERSAEIEQAMFRASTSNSELGVTASLDEMQACHEGGVGWAAGRGHFEMQAPRVPVALPLSYTKRMAHGERCTPTHRLVCPRRPNRRSPRAGRIW